MSVWRRYQAGEGHDDYGMLCVAACPNCAAQLFTAAKIEHLNLLPQGQAERWSRVENMVETMEEYFGSCTNHADRHEACPKKSASTSSRT